MGVVMCTFVPADPKNHFNVRKLDLTSTDACDRAQEKTWDEWDQQELRKAVTELRDECFSEGKGAIKFDWELGGSQH